MIQGLTLMTATKIQSAASLDSGQNHAGMTEGTTCGRSMRKFSCFSRQKTREYGTNCLKGNEQMSAILRLRYVWCVLPAWVVLAHFLGGPAHAHYLWVVEEDGQYVVARGTPPNDREAYHPDAVTLIKAFDRGGAEVVIERVNDKAGVFFRAQQPPSVATVMCDWGSRVKTTRGKKLMTRKEAEAQGFRVLEAFTSIQTSKTLFEDGDAVLKNLGMRFEVVPLSSPFQLKPGAPLEVRLLFDGAPLKDTMVSTDGCVETKTDQNGMARVDGFHEGWNIIMARHTVSAAGDPDINYRQFMTFLLFKVPR
jgi:nickel transport protein